MESLSWQKLDAAQCNDKSFIWLTCSVILRPRRLLEQIKGISEQKATKILVEGKLLPRNPRHLMGSYANENPSPSLKTSPHGLHNSH
jgi:hypothetical protein